VGAGLALEDTEGFAMKQSPLKLLLVAALVALPSAAYAQKKDAKDDKAGAKTEKPAKAEPEESGVPGGPPVASGGLTEGGAGPDSFICEANPEACQVPKLIKDYAEKDLKDSQVYAVQQIYALRRHRFEISPYWSATLNDQFVGHPGPGLALNYYVTNVLAVGVNFNYYQPFNSDAEFNKLNRESTRLAVPITEYQFGANLNFTYVPLYGKFAGFGDFIFHWDGYVVGGIGALSTRPIAVVDAENRNFQWKTKVAFNAGVGLRVFINRWLSAFLEVRDYVYNEQLEATAVARPYVSGDTKGTAKDPSTWLDKSSITNAVQAQFGISIFLPFSWTYKLPK
jgi:outer membrane beta-barrel protein